MGVGSFLLACLPTRDVRDLVVGKVQHLFLMIKIGEGEGRRVNASMRGIGL